MHAVLYLGKTGFFGAVGAAEDLPATLNTVADNPGSALRAGWRERIDRTLETVKYVRLASMGSYGEGLVVAVAAVFTLFHGWLCSFRMVDNACFHYNETSH
jgi:hypothetical protein